MNFPFLGLFKKKSAQPATATAVVEAPKPPPLEKSSADRLRKTVMPTGSRNAASEDVFRTPTNHAPAPSAPAPVIAPAPAPAPAAAPARAVAPKVSAPASASPRPIAFSLSSPPRSVPAPQARVAAAPASATPTERTIMLELGDIVQQLPAGTANTGADMSRRIALRAAEIEKGMSNGRPSVSLASLYEQVPEIFLQAPTGTGDVPLPFAKVLEQFAGFQVRRDQKQDDSVPQVETPFLRVALEDNQRFGTTTPNLQTADMPPVRVEPATAKTIAAAEPEPVAKEPLAAPVTKPAPTRISLPNDKAAPPATGASAATPADISAPPAPMRIPFKLTPNGTGEPASESVPASSGPSVPITLPSPPAWSGFKVSAPSEAARPKEPASTEAKPTPIRPAAKSKTQPRTGPTITLPLRAIFQNLPPFQLAGDPDDVPPDVTIDLPFSVIEPQLALGRVAVSPKQFEEALPDKYLRLFDPNEANTPVSLPLQDVLANLPGTLLRIRDDQEEVETGAVFETPFSKAADEDAKRLNVATGPVAKQNVDEPEAPAEVAPSEPASKIERTPLQKTLDTDADLDAKAIVAHASRLPGVKACAIMFADGLSLAGSLPFELGADGLCAMAPSLVKRLETQVAETKFGALHSVTLFCENAPVSFFMHDNICLTVVHEDGEISADVRERLSFTTREVAGMYPPPV